jgi:hypothetical protein
MEQATCTDQELINCCNPGGEWANTYMLGVCAEQGCHYVDNYCSGSDYYNSCVSSCTGNYIGKKEKVIYLKIVE